MKTEDEVIALAKEHGACPTKVIVFGGKVDGFAFTNTNLQAFAAACTLTHEQAYAIQCKAHFEACRILPEDKLSILPAACAEPAVPADERQSEAVAQTVTLNAAYRHKRTGGVYMTHSIAKMKSGEGEWESCIIYHRSEDGAWFVRDFARFVENFEPVADHSAPAAPLTVTDEEVAQAYVDFKTIKNDVSNDMRLVLKAFVARKGNPK